jgi:hypothetical protein
MYEQCGDIQPLVLRICAVRAKTSKQLTLWHTRKLRKQQKKLIDLKSIFGVNDSKQTHLPRTGSSSQGIPKRHDLNTLLTPYIVR